MKWVHEFYQRNPDNDSNDLYYFSQREARAVLESVRTIKKGYYEAKVITIESDEPFRIMHVGGGCKHQYRIGEKFTLRQHKNKKGHAWFCDCSERFWYDPKIPGRPYGERFTLIEEKEQEIRILNYGFERLFDRRAKSRIEKKK